MKTSDSPLPLVSIITVNYNQTGLTLALLNSIRQQEYARTEVIVVDNASDIDPRTSIAGTFPEVNILRNERNLGFAGGNNVALPYATGEFLFFVNNDAEIPPGCIATLVRHFHEHPQTGIASPLICYFHETPETIQYAGMTPVHPITARNQTIGSGEIDRGQYQQSMRTAYAHGAGMMISRAALQECGPMDTGFFLYYEELDWCERIRRQGYEIWVVPAARLYHKESATVETLGALKTYYLNRNRVRFMRRNFSGAALLFFFVFLWLVTVPKNTILLLLRQQNNNLAAFWQGILWNFGLKQNRFERVNG